MKLALIDADCAVYAMTGQFPALVERLANREPGSVVISAVNFAEIALGSMNDKLPMMDVLDAFVAAIPVVPFDEAAALAYSTLPFKRGRFDRLLAAHALSLDAVVITNNAADFADVPGLAVENWTIG